MTTLSKPFAENTTLIQRISGNHSQFNLFTQTLKVKLEGMTMQEELDWERKGKSNGQIEPLLKDIDVDQRYPVNDDGTDLPDLASAKKELKRKVNKLNGMLHTLIPSEYWNQLPTGYQSTTNPVSQWNDIVAHYGDSNMATVVKLVVDFFAKVNQDFTPLDKFLANIKVLANELNAKTEQSLGSGAVMISQPLLAILPLLLNLIWYLVLGRLIF